MLKRAIFLASLLLTIGSIAKPAVGSAIDPDTSIIQIGNSAREQNAQQSRLEIQLSRHRVVLYYRETVIKSYAIAIGRPGWETPTGKFKVLQMLKDPTWTHPLKKNIVIPGGDPENPLGRYWIGFWTDGKNWIGFHGTPNPKSVGTSASHGCIRMYNRDIEELFHQVSLGTEVTVVQ